MPPGMEPLGVLAVNLVKQLHTTGCGIACVAMLTNKTYNLIDQQAVDEKFFKPTGKRYTTSRQLSLLAAKHNINIDSRRKAFKGFDRLPDRAILSVKMAGSVRNWHWIVFYRLEDSIFLLDPEQEAILASPADLKRVSRICTHYLGVEAL